MIQTRMTPLHSTPKNTPRTGQGVGATISYTTLYMYKPNTDPTHHTKIKYTRSHAYTIHFAKTSEQNYHHASRFGIKGRQHPDFPGGHPPEYYPSLRLLNFAERTGYGAISLRWPSTLHYTLYNYLCLPHTNVHTTHTEPLVCDMNPHLRACTPRLLFHMQRVSSHSPYY